jgi:hypothetical protein
MKRIENRSRQTFKKEWFGRNVWVKFTDRESGNCYCYPHDIYAYWYARECSETPGQIAWVDDDWYSNSRLSARQAAALAPFVVPTPDLVK